jgi:hypothetical protein
MAATATSNALILNISCRNRHAERIEIKPEDCPRTIGRDDLRQWLGVTEDTLGDISWEHFRIEHQNGFRIVDSSRNGTLVESVDGRLPPQRLDGGASRSVVDSLRLRLENGSLDDLADVVIDVTLRSSRPSTRPRSSVSGIWTDLLGELSRDRTVHLVGMPGVGKSFLANQLAHPAPGPKQQRDQVLGNVVAALIDGLALTGDDQGLWHDLACQMVIALDLAAQELPAGGPIQDEAQALLVELRTGTARRPRDAALRLRRMLQTVVRDAATRVVFIFDHFDDILARLEPDMLAVLYQLYSYPWSRGQGLDYVVITRRPLERLRAGLDERQAQAFAALFSEPPL